MIVFLCLQMVSERVGERQEHCVQQVLLCGGGAAPPLLHISPVQHIICVSVGGVGVSGWVSVSGWVGVVCG